MLVLGRIILLPKHIPKCKGRSQRPGNFPSYIRKSCCLVKEENWVVVSNNFIFTPTRGNDPTGVWNHQLVLLSRNHTYHILSQKVGFVCSLLSSFFNHSGTVKFFQSFRNQSFPNISRIYIQLNKGEDSSILRCLLLPRHIPLAPWLRQRHVWGEMGKQLLRHFLSMLQSKLKVA